MQKILLFTIALLVSILFWGCTQTENGDTTYQISNKVTKIDSADPYLNGSLYEVIIYEYSGNNVVSEMEIDKISVNGKTSIFTAEEKTNTIRISFRLLPKASPNYNIPENSRKYTVQYYSLKKGKLTVVEIDDDTRITNELKKSNSGNNDEKMMKELVQEGFESIK
jgi:hypothetical protein